MLARQNEALAAEKIIEENIERYHEMRRTRKVEIKMRDIPEKIRQIKEKAINEVVRR
jgi:glutamyl-tRNA reductase